MLHNNGPYGPNDTPINMGAPVNMTQATPPMNIGHNLSNLSKISQPAAPTPSPHYNLPDYPTYGHPSLTMPPQLSPFQNYNPLGYHPSYLGQNPTSVHETGWQNGMLPMNLNTQVNHGANMLNYPAPFTKSHMDSISSSEYKESLNRRNVPINIPQVPSKAFQNDDSYSLYNVNHDKFNRYNNFHDTVKSQDRPLLDNTRRKSLENTVRLIENILISTSKNKELQRNQDAATNKDLQRYQDINKDQRNQDLDLNKDLNRFQDPVTSKDLQRYQDPVIGKDLHRYQDPAISKDLNRYQDPVISKELNRYLDPVNSKDLQKYQDPVISKDVNRYLGPVNSKDLQRYQDPVISKDLHRYQDPVISKDLNRYEDPVISKDLHRYQDPVISKDFNRYQDPVISKDLQTKQDPVVSKDLQRYQDPVVSKNLQRYQDPVISKDLQRKQDPLLKDLLRKPDPLIEKNLQHQDPIIDKITEHVEADPFQILLTPNIRTEPGNNVKEASNTAIEKNLVQTEDIKRGKMVEKNNINITKNVENSDKGKVMNVGSNDNGNVTNIKDDTQTDESSSESDLDVKPMTAESVIVKIEMEETPDPMIVVKVEQIGWTDTDYLNPFPRDVNGLTRDNIPNSTIVDSETSIQDATEAVKTGPPLNSVYECPHCGLLFSHPKRFLIHTKWHSFGLTNAKRMEIAKEREFKRKQRSEARVVDRMNSKEVTDDATGKKVYPCKECDKAFSSKGSLKNHKQRSHPTRIRECKICRKTVLGWMALRAHLASHNNEAGFQCADCPKKFKYAHSLAKHRDCHLEKTLSCPKCDKMFGSNSQLSAHQKVHERAQRGATYRCTYCAKAFYEAYNLSVHERTHRNERPFLCEICNTSFGTNSSLQRHIKVSHNAAKPFECRTCHRFFVSEPIRDRHEVRQHGSADDLKYACKQCDCRYLKAKDLKKHAYKAHPKGKRKKKDQSESDSSQ